MSYAFLRRLLFQFDPEIAHFIALKALQFAHYLNLIKKYYPPIIATPTKVMSLQFPNVIGLAAGLDKNGDYIDALADLGFGFLEIGTITRKPQIGNPRPRLFRLTEQEAIINRMGFNNKGVDYLINQLKKTKYKGILGINIGKNRDTSIENAIDDYLYLYRCVYRYASYVTINISSPNTENLRHLQHGELLQSLLRTLKQEQTLQNELTQRYVPLVVKIAPDLTHEELASIAHILLTEKIDGIVATNTTLSREGVENAVFAKELGGLSGKPLRAKTTAVIQHLNEIIQGQIPIIGCGGIFSAEDVKEKILAGASLVQIYSGLIYRGPALIRECYDQNGLCLTS